MSEAVHKMIEDAMRRGTWTDPGSDVLADLIGGVFDLPELELFADIETMNDVWTQVRDSGYVDDPEFCMVPNADARTGPHDSRLAHEHATFIGGSRVPGDDVFLVVDGETEPMVRVFDWRLNVPKRWADVAKLDEFIKRLESGGPT